MPIAKVGDINIEYYVEGTGPPLLMIMGWMGSAGFWGEAFLERLRPHFQIIRISNRGTGLTDKPSGDYSIRTMAEDAAGLLRELGIERVHVREVVADLRQQPFRLLALEGRPLAGHEHIVCVVHAHRDEHLQIAPPAFVADQLGRVGAHVRQLFGVLVAPP